MISIIIPTYNEKENIKKLIPRVFRVLEKAKIRGEVIIVDDNSPDGTAEEAEKLAKKFRVRVLKRKGKLGLSSAVLDGFRIASGDILGVMDADFSHPPEKIPEMLRYIRGSRESGYNMVIGSRKVKGGSIEDWPIKRKLISKGATVLARPITRIKDPMSGFFMIKKSVLRGAGLNPRGFKIALEIAVKGRHKGRITEIPIKFRDRRYGESKLGKKEIINYLLHLMKLYKYKITG